MHPSRTAVFSVRGSEQAAARSEGMPPDSLFPGIAAKRLDRIDGQIQDRADSLIPFAHGSQPPDLLLLFLRHDFLPSCVLVDSISEPPALPVELTEPGVLTGMFVLCLRTDITLGCCRF